MWGKCLRTIGTTVLAFVVAALVLPTVAVHSATTDLVIRSSRVQYDIGDRIDWTVDWTKQTPGTSAEQVLVNLEGQHEFVDGSIQLPHGWSVEYSSDGETFSDVPTETVSHLRLSHDAVTAGGIRVAVPIPRPIPPIVTAASGGDGYIPMLAGDRVYSVWHHLTANGTPPASVVCIDTLTGKACAGYPKKLGMQTSYNQGQGVYVNRKLYFKNRDATTHGVMCWDMVTEEACGYVPIATLGPVTGTAGGDGGWDQFSSPISYKDRMYFAAQNHRVYCFDPDTETICAGYTLAGKAMARSGEPHVTTRRLNDVIQHGGQLFFSLANSWADVPVPLGTKVECFDLDAGTPCAGFGTAGVVAENAGTAYMFTQRDATGAPIGFCLGVQSGAGDVPIQSDTPCYDYSGTVRTTIPSALSFAQFRPYNVEEATIGTRTFFGRYSTLGASCYDWSTSAPCAGTNFDVNGRATKTTGEYFYGFVARGKCMVGLGHKGIFMSIDPTTGSTPCVQVAESTFVASAESHYCRDTKYMGGWNAVGATDVTAGDFSRFDVAVADGATRLTGDPRSTPLSLASMKSTSPLAVSMAATLSTGADPWKTGTPALEFDLTGSHQFCFQTVVKPKPTTVTDVVIDVVTDEGEKTDSVTPSPEVLASGVLDEQLPQFGHDSRPEMFLASSLIVAGGLLLAVRRLRLRR